VASKEIEQLQPSESSVDWVSSLSPPELTEKARAFQIQKIALRIAYFTTNIDRRIPTRIAERNQHQRNSEN